MKVIMMMMMYLVFLCVEQTGEFYQDKVPCINESTPRLIPTLLELLFGHPPNQVLCQQNVRASLIIGDPMPSSSVN